MSDFLEHTMTDLRAGRQTWRVFAALCSVAFAVSVAAQLV
jgi:hypothetical protein